MSVQTEAVMGKAFIKTILEYSLCCSLIWFEGIQKLFWKHFFNMELQSELVLAIFQTGALSFITLDMGFYFQLFESSGRSSFPSDIYFNS